MTRNALAGVGKVDSNLMIEVGNLNINAPCIIHGIQRIPNKVLDYPIEQRAGNTYRDMFFFGKQADGHLAGCSLLHIVDHLHQSSYEVLVMELRLAAYFAEALCNKLQPVQ